MVSQQILDTFVFETLNGQFGVSDPNKVKVSNLDETFGDNPKIYDKSMAGQTGYDEFGLIFFNPLISSSIFFSSP